jgi:hypothetical protein
VNGYRSRCIIRVEGLYVSPGLGRPECGTQTKWERWQKGLAESDARVSLRRHGSGCWDAFLLHRDRQANAHPERRGADEGQKRKKEMPGGRTVTTGTREDGMDDRRRDVLHDRGPCPHPCSVVDKIGANTHINRGHVRRCTQRGLDWPTAVRQGCTFCK